MRRLAWLLVCSAAAWALPSEVAPRVDNPVTPPTRSLSPAQARQALVDDWLYQAEGWPLALRARQEIVWARALADRLESQHAQLSLAAPRAELANLEARYAGLGGGQAAAAREGYRPAAGQRLRLGFDEPTGVVARDLSGAGLDARWSGRVASVPGVYGRAAALSGGVTGDLGASLSACVKGSYTAWAWIRTTSQEADVLGNGTVDGCLLLMSYRGVVRGHQWTDQGPNAVDGKTPVADGRWHHIAMAADGKKLSVYVDGRLDAEAALVGRVSAADKPLLVAGRQASGGPSFTGALDELAFFDRALSADEIHSEYEAGRAALGSTNDASEGPAREFYLAVRDVKRRILLANPAVDFGSVLFIDQPYPAGAEWRHQARHRDGMMAVPGGRLLVLDGLGPDGKLRQLAPEQPGAFWRPDLSFDGQRVLYCYKPHNEPSFHLYEMGLDGGAPRQLTSGPYDDLDPIYLPDGHITFTTTRCNTYVRCMPYTFSYTLARCEGDGSGIYLTSHNSEPDWCPSLLNDGRLIYSRWEYTDKALWRIQSLWTANPDGTAHNTFWGNQSVWPDHLAEPRAIPGSRRVMFCGLAHHDWFAGSVGIIDPAQGDNFPLGLTKVTAETPWPECGPPPSDPVESADYHTSGAFAAYKTPYPLNEQDFMVSARRADVDRFDLYLMDADGNRELLYPATNHIWHAIPVRSRVKPPVIPDRVIWPGHGAERAETAPGVFYSADVTQGVPELKGKVAAVRLVEMVPKTYTQWTRDSRFSGPSVSCFQEDGLKRVLGTVPVESDGSVSFEAPAGKALHLQLLDDRGRALQTMRSFTGLMPGEKRGCVGCHERHSKAPVSSRAEALLRAPRQLTPPSWGTGTVSYNKQVQPVLSRYCGRCHTGTGEGRAKLDLTVKPSGVYREPYVSLVMSGLAGALLCENYAQSDPASYVTAPPLKSLSYASPLVRLLMSGQHHGVTLDPQSLEALITWIDVNCPYLGEEEVRAMPDPDYPGLEALGVRPLCGSYPVILRP